MITGMPLSGIGLLRQADLEGTARAHAALEGASGAATLSVEIEQAGGPALGAKDDGAAANPSPDRHRIDISV
ncbi:hypothetical protein [uncultured Methylobacterium sp.]|uniref:hypothetical protein n=1 Tax=uncultured Methylobacterium sp. TaxID=157278 RepID=UPI0035CBC108